MSRAFHTGGGPGLVTAALSFGVILMVSFPCVPAPGIVSIAKAPTLR